MKIIGRSLVTCRLGALALAFVVCASAVQADPVTITATITADNHYALFTGNANGSGLIEIGRNESGAYGSPGTYNWSEAEMYTNFQNGPGRTIYVAAWSDDAVAQGWIGQFVFNYGATSKTVLTNTTDWKWFGTGHDYDDSGGPSLVDVEAHATSATTSASWSAVPNQKNYGDSPWGSISGISSGAKWIWGDNMIDVPNPNSEYHIYRLKIPGESDSWPDSSVPEPTTLALLALGCASLIARRRSS